MSNLPYTWRHNVQLQVLLLLLLPRCCCCVFLCASATTAQWASMQAAMQAGRITTTHKNIYIYIYTYIFFLHIIHIYYLFQATDWLCINILTYWLYILYCSVCWLCRASVGYRWTVCRVSVDLCLFLWGWMPRDAASWVHKISKSLLLLLLLDPPFK